MKQIHHVCVACIKVSLKWGKISLTFICMQGCAPLYLRDLLFKRTSKGLYDQVLRTYYKKGEPEIHGLGEIAFHAYVQYLWNGLLDKIKAAGSVQNLGHRYKLKETFLWCYNHSPWFWTNIFKCSCFSFSWRLRQSICFVWARTEP